MRSFSACLLHTIGLQEADRQQRLHFTNKIGCYSLFDLTLMCFFFLFFVEIGTLLVTGGCYSDTSYNVVLKAMVKMLLVIYVLWKKTLLYFLYKGRGEKSPRTRAEPRVCYPTPILRSSDWLPAAIRWRLCVSHNMEWVPAFFDAVQLFLRAAPSNRTSRRKPDGQLTAACKYVLAVRD